MSITKSLRNAVSRISGKSSKTSAKGADNPMDYSGLVDVWPDGTWDMKWGNNTFHEMDLVTRGLLLEAWTVEQLRGQEKAMGRALNPSMFYADPIPLGWKPKAKSVKYALAKADARVEPFVLGKLRQAGRLRG